MLFNKVTFRQQSTPESQEKLSRFSLSALRKNPVFQEFQVKLERGAKEIKILVEKLWLQ